jgi:hypothetical protein
MYLLIQIRIYNLYILEVLWFKYLHFYLLSFIIDLVCTSFNLPLKSEDLIHDSILDLTSLLIWGPSQRWFLLFTLL